VKRAAFFLGAVGFLVTVAGTAQAGGDGDPSSGATKTGIPQGFNSRAAYADSLFEEGVRLMKADDCPRATSKFLSSQQLDPSAATLLNLATCYARLGRNGSAWRTYQQAAAAALEEGNPTLRDRALNAISILTPALTRLTIVAPTHSGQLSLMLNGQPIALEEGLPVPLDPGENVLEARAPGRQAWRHVVSGELGATIVIEVPELAATASPPVNRDARLASRLPPVIMIGAGAAGIVVGSFFGASAIVANNESKSNCRGNHCNLAGAELRNSAMSKATIANYSIGIGALLVATGLVLRWALPSDPERSVGLTPWIAESGSSAGLSVRGRL
jgi:hypothetical protein